MKNNHVSGLPKKGSQFQALSELAKATFEALENDPNKRFIIALAGAPGSGKSTVAKKLADIISLKAPETNPVVVPMDGYHLDNSVLSRLGLMDRKGTSQTFDALGYLNTLRRIRQDSEKVWVPEFDRNLDLARAGAIEISSHSRLVITEGNYLLLNEEPWSQVRVLADKTVFINVDLQTLTERLMQRWLAYGYSESDARQKVEENDLLNAQEIHLHSFVPDWYLSNG